MCLLCKIDSPRLRRTLLTAVLFAMFCDAASAVRRRDGDGPADSSCPTDTAITARLIHDELPLVGLAIGIDAAPATILESGRSGGECVVVIHPLTHFQWQVVSRPPGSSAALSGGSTLHARLTPDVAGDYRVRFTACPGGCSVPSSLGSGSATVSAAVREITITAESGIAPDARTEPYVPPRPEAIQPELDPTGCPPGADTFSAAWVTVEPWAGKNDYRKMAGRVLRSKVSRKDNILNHDDKDHNSVVELYPEFEGLLPAGQGQDHFEVEWERRTYSDHFWPTQRDRLAAEGYWIHDCAHGKRTEIHPPVLTAAQRPRAIELPESLGLGSDVWVPGVITDVWVNKRAGEITGNCSLTGLHDVPFDNVPLASCLPQSEGFSFNPIQKVFTFDIHLPRDPLDVIGTVKEPPPPPVPLFIEIQPGGGPDPVIDQNTEDSNVLRVTLDLTEHNGNTYSRRIVAGWPIPRRRTGACGAGSCASAPYRSTTTPTDLFGATAIGVSGSTPTTAATSGRWSSTATAA